ncbi:MAG: hypothetical protein ABL867_04125 [Rickettsiales bacterium]
MFAPVEFLELAKTLHTQATKESCARSAISRAYYAAFLTAREKSGIAVTSKDIHGLVLQYCYTYLPVMADDLKGLRRRRNSADYDLTHTFASKDSNWAIKTAEAIIDDLR